VRCDDGDRATLSEKDPLRDRREVRTNAAPLQNGLHAPSILTHKENIAIVVEKKKEESTFEACCRGEKEKDSRYFFCSGATSLESSSVFFFFFFFQARLVQGWK
jgi:hypothetical protein